MSTPLVAAIGEHLAAGNQVLLFLNRRGFAPALFCPELQGRGAMHALRRAHHRAREGRRAALPSLRRASGRSSGFARTCGSERIAVGAGTQRVDDELAALFPTARIARLDRDITSRKGSLAAVLRDVESGNIEILIGTQMLTKGHDFPRVTLVGVLNADQGLFGTDPRSHERLAQTILQVAGRAGRADRPGEVVIQTHYPDHPLLECLLEQDYTAFATLALAERREVALAAVHASRGVACGSGAPRPRHVVPRGVRAVAARRAPGHVDDLGTGAAADGAQGRALSRSAVVAERASVRRCTSWSAARCAAVRNSRDARSARWSIDVDPLEV